MTKETNNQPSEDSRWLSTRKRTRYTCDILKLPALRKVTLFALVCISLLSLTCKDVGVQVPDKSFTLIAEDASCTEVYLNLKIGAGITSRTVTLKRDTITLFTKTIDAAETAITDTSLLPNHTYCYTASLNGSLASSSTARTMDTTSHNWIFDQPVLFGSGSSSSFQDIQILSDSFAIAVGDVYQGGDPQSYGLAVWNGQQWNLRKLYAQTQEGYIQNIRPITGVFIFSTTDIWLADGNAYHWNGHDTLLTPYWISGYTGNPHPVLGPNQGVNKYWGTSSNDLYGCGVNGGIAHYNGSTWTKIESGTNVDLTDIYGTPDGKEVWACGSLFNNTESVLLRKQDPQWQTLWRHTQPAPPYNNELLGTLWTSGGEYFLTGTGDVFRHSLVDRGLIHHEPVNLGAYAYRIRGNGRNDVFTAGDFATVWHFNGATWYRYNNLYNADDRLYSLAVSPSMCVAVGRTYGNSIGSALIIIGRR